MASRATRPVRHRLVDDDEHQLVAAGRQGIQGPQRAVEASRAGHRQVGETVREQVLHVVEQLALAIGQRPLRPRPSTGQGRRTAGAAAASRRR